MGSCHPIGSLYENPLNLSASQAEHANFRKTLKDQGCIVYTVREILAKDCEVNVVARVQLEDFAKKCLVYKLVEDENQNIEITENEAYYLSEKYKQEVIEKMDIDQLVEVILTNPTILLKKSEKDTALIVVSYTYQPLVNLVFCRDQQITTSKGIVMGRLSSPIRQAEVEVMKFCFNKLNIPIVGNIVSPGTLEGGDFYSAGSDLSMIGIGLRSNMNAVQQLFDQNLFGTKYVAVVKDFFDQNQQRMHLDTVFNIISPKLCLLLDIIQGKSSPFRRLVDEYFLDFETGKYKLGRHDVEFCDYLKSKEFNIITMTEEMQERYGCNGLNLGRQIFISVDKLSANHISRSPNFKGKIILIDFKNITNMYGSVHCCSQVISRSKSTMNFYDITNFLQSCYNGNISFLNYWIQSGFDINISDYEDKTALHVACIGGHEEIVRILIKNGASINSIDALKRTPLDILYQKNSNEILINLLKINGAKTKQELDQENKINLISHSENLNQNSSNLTLNRFLMICPNKFEINWLKKIEAHFSLISKTEYNRLIHEGGKRFVNSTLVSEISKLHEIFTNQLSLDVYLKSHQIYGQTPDPLFFGDWFSTDKHSTIFIYPMMYNEYDQSREELILFLKSFNQRTIEFRKESAKKLNIKITDNNNVLSESISFPEKINLDSSLLVFKKETNTLLFAHNYNQIELETFKILSQIIGYQFKPLKLSEKVPEWLQKTRMIFSIFSKFNMVCIDAFDEADQKQIMQMLSNEQNIIFEIEQASNFAILGAIEVIKSDGSLNLIISKDAYQVYSKEQISKIESLNYKILIVEISSIEKISGGSLFNLVGSI